MNKRIRFPKFIFEQSVLEEIRRTVGSLPAETGGLLGDDGNGTISRFYFDREAVRSSVTYTVDPARINPIIDAWNAAGAHLCGFVHSHPSLCLEPSAPDIEYAQRIIQHPGNERIQHLLIPIVQSSAEGEFSLRLFAVTRELENAVFEVPYEIIPSAETSLFPVESPLYQKTFARVRESYDLSRLHHSMAIIIGCGGAASFVEDLGRAGVRFFVLVDPDVVSESNIATQQCYLKDVGRPKVQVLKERLLQINPLAVITALPKPLDAFDDEALRRLIFDDTRGDEIQARILCGLTDSFPAQMRVNLLGLKLGIPALSAQVYGGGAGAEIVFSVPGATRQCLRCILSQRYAAYIERGFENDATSEGSHYFATPRLNATKLFVAMSILHFGSRHKFWGPMLSRIGQRNCIQIRCDPDLQRKLGLDNFDKVFAGALNDRLFCDETIWLPQHPENKATGYPSDCPDCGGTGNLEDSKGRVPDTRALIPASLAQQRAPSNHAKISQWFKRLLR
jgi:proteasome lid subunit RPN8/RPN11